MSESVSENLRGVLIQFFHWNYSTDGILWKELKSKSKDLFNAGFTAVWLPPAYKGWGGKQDVGYGAYDLYDYGEFDQKETVRTKYGNKKEYIEAVKYARKIGLNIYADIVLNHKMGADKKEAVKSIVVNPENRNITIGDYQEREHWTVFDFPGRNGKYSDMKWNKSHFDAVKEYGTIYKIKNKNFETHVDDENANYDFLMGCDLDMDSEELQEEIKKWTEWSYNTINVDGFRLDAVKHIRSFYFMNWLKNIREYTGRKLFAVGEYWSGNISKLRHYINETQGKISLFDIPLHFNFHNASKQGKTYDLRTILNNTLVKENPQSAVTFVDNHDTQALQSMESLVEAWFKPLAYALILLRDEGYPCVFYPDYYGAYYKGTKNNYEYEIWMASHKWLLDKFLQVRKEYTYGMRRDYFDNEDIIAWTFEGDNEHKSSAIIMSNNESGKKWMQTNIANTEYSDITGHIQRKIFTNDHGWAEFSCRGSSVSVWIETG